MSQGLTILQEENGCPEKSREGKEVDRLRTTETMRGGGLASCEPTMKITSCAQTGSVCLFILYHLQQQYRQVSEGLSPSPGSPFRFSLPSAHSSRTIGRWLATHQNHRGKSGNQRLYQRRVSAHCLWQPPDHKHLLPATCRASTHEFH